MSYESLFANPSGRTSRVNFIGALITLLAVAAFYYHFVKGRNGEWVLVTLLYPAAVLHARRLHDLGHTGWLLVIPGALDITAIWLRLYGPNHAAPSALTLAALVVSAGFMLWCLIGNGQAQANRFGQSVAA